MVTVGGMMTVGGMVAPGTKAGFGFAIGGLKVPGGPVGIGPGLNVAGGAAKVPGLTGGPGLNA